MSATDIPDVTGASYTYLLHGHAPNANWTGLFEPKKNILGETNITRLVDAYQAWTDEDRFCRVVDLAEIEENDFNLNISRYIDTLEPEQPIDVQAELQKLWTAEKARDEAAARMNALLKEMGYAG